MARWLNGLRRCERLQTLAQGGMGQFADTRINQPALGIEEQGGGKRLLAKMHAGLALRVEQHVTQAELVRSQIGLDL